MDLVPVRKRPALRIRRPSPFCFFEGGDAICLGEWGKGDGECARVLGWGTKERSKGRKEVERWFAVRYDGLPGYSLPTSLERLKIAIQAEGARRVDHDETRHAAYFSL